MAYGGYYSPQNYGPQNYNSQGYMPQNYGPQSYGVQQPSMQQPVPQQPPQIQNGGFMQVPSEDIARSYPVAPGNCVTFKIEGKPIVMEKSMGFSQLEAPRVDRYRLVREEDAPNESKRPQNEPKTDDLNNKAIDVLKDEIKNIWSEINGIKERIIPKEDEGA